MMGIGFLFLHERQFQAFETVGLQTPQGLLHANQPAPYTPAGGQGTNGTEPVYRVQSDFDYQSISVGLYQEWIELDLFHYGLATYSVEDFEAAGLTAEDRFLLQFMAEQEVGHATLLTNMLGPNAPKQCTCKYFLLCGLFSSHLAYTNSDCRR